MKFNDAKSGVFAHGTITDNEQGVNLTNSNKPLNWVAVKYYTDWAIYASTKYNSIEQVHRLGLYMPKGDVHKLVDCDDAMLNKYRK